MFYSNISSTERRGDVIPPILSKPGSKDATKSVVLIMNSAITLMLIFISCSQVHFYTVALFDCMVHGYRRQTRFTCDAHGGSSITGKRIWRWSHPAGSDATVWSFQTELLLTTERPENRTTRTETKPLINRAKFRNFTYPDRGIHHYLKKNKTKTNS